MTDTTDSGPKRRAPVRSDHARTWHLDQPEAPDGGERYNKAVVRRIFSPEARTALGRRTGWGDGSPAADRSGLSHGSAAARTGTSVDG